MSTHVEWMDAGYIAVERARAGAEMADGQLVDHRGALVISADEVLVIEGDLDQLQTLARQISQVVGLTP